VILHEVLTTEKTPFNYRVAGLGSRFLAYSIDFLCMSVLLVAGWMFASVYNAARPGVGTAILIWWQFALQWGFFLFFEWLWRGQTPGKRALGIRVIQWNGTSVSFAQSAIRNIVRFVDGPLPFCYAIGFAVGACNRENRRLGDFAAGTLVVHVDRRTKPIRAFYDGRTEVARERLTLWRQRLASLERVQKQTLLDLCLRRDQLRIEERTRLFRSAAQFFEDRLELTPDEYESDEKFVLQLAATLSEQGPPETEAPRGRR
jgi:uncharacterized RDD family membrane protein YckC